MFVRRNSDASNWARRCASRRTRIPARHIGAAFRYIAAEAEFTPKQIQTKDERVKLVYRIKIDVDNPNRELKSNMPVDAEIELTNAG